MEHGNDLNTTAQNVPGAQNRPALLLLEDRTEETLDLD
jgi:hypothetical protein